MSGRKTLCPEDVARCLTAWAVSLGLLDGSTPSRGPESRVEGFSAVVGCSGFCTQYLTL